MRSIKTKLCSLGMAAAMLLALAGCNLSTPSSVGSIGGVDIPAGVYLLAQYDAYNTASALADLATGETANDVSAVLRAECTGTIGDEEVTATGEEYIARLTLRALEYYAAVEQKFADLGATLEDAAMTTVQDSVDSLWQTNGDLYVANGIGRQSVQAYLENAQKASTILTLTYGPEGSDPVSDAEYTDFLNNECYYIETVQLPLVDYTTYTMADDDQKSTIMDLAAACAEELNRTATGETAGSAAVYEAASTYVPQAMEALGATMESAEQAAYYVGAQLYTPDDLAGYGGDGYNNLTDPLDAVALNQWTTIDLGTVVLAARRVDPLQTYTVEDLTGMYDLLTALKGEELQNQFYADGAAMEHALNEGAMRTYSASKIKKEV